MQKQVKVMKRLSLVLFALMSVSTYAQCDFKTFLNTYFEIYEANDSLIELGVNVNRARKQEVNKGDVFYDCAIKYFPSQYRSLYACHIHNYYIIMFWKVLPIDDDYDIDDYVLVLCDERGKILDQYIHRRVVRTYMASSRYYLQKDTLCWRYWDEKDPSGAYTEQQFKIIKDKIISLPQL